MKRFIFMIALMAYSNGVQCSNTSLNIDMNEGFELSQPTKIDLTCSLDDSQMSRTEQSVLYPDTDLFKDASDDKVGRYTPIPKFNEVIPSNNAKQYYVDIDRLDVINFDSNESED